ncbi:MAG: hypothetical protein KDI02_18295, partial [Anaerolineae bacterium]|nr:hypothetical protein [Anaerolineae bacterium]
MRTKPFALLRTKLHQPRLSPDLVPRPHLIEYLNHNPHRPLTLIVAPAGFGKTTLAVEWLQSRTQPVAWLSLDQGDDELRHFLRYVLAALQTIFPDSMSDSLSLLQGLELPPVDYLRTIFINELAAAAQNFTLVLDDLYLVQTPSIYQFLEKVIDYLPEQAHLVLISRLDPPLPLARLRARGQMTDVRTGDLRFRPTEIAAFLEQTVGRERLPAEGIAAVVEQTEGWAAGVRLASLSLRRPSPPTGAMRADQYAMSYLLDEVLLQQPAPIRAFLLQTAILDRFCKSLCEVILHRNAAEQGSGDPHTPTSSQAIIAYLDQANLFVVPLDDEQQWYRYHHLFQESLKHRLQAEYSPTDIAALHRRASHWLAEQGYIEEAIDHALAAGETEQAARLVEQHRHTLLNYEEMATLSRWLAKLPEALLEQRPALLLARIWVTKLRYGAPAIIDLIAPVEALLQAQPQTVEHEPLWGELYTLQSESSYFQSDGQQSIRLGRQALDLLPPHQAFIRGTAMMFWAGGHRLVGQGDVAEQLLTEVLQQAPQQQPPVYTLRLYTALNTFYLIRANFHRLIQTATQQIKLAEKAKLVTQVSWANHYCGHAHYELNKLTAAAHYYLALAQHPFRVIHTGFNVAPYTLALTYQAQGYPDRATQSFDRLADMIPHQPLTLLAERLQVRLALLRGDAAAARQIALPLTFDPEREELMNSIDSPGRILAKLWLAQRTEASLRKAADLLEQLLELAEAQHNIWRKIEILAMQALVRDAQGERDKALETLTEAVTLARPGGVIRTFVDLGPHLVPLIVALAERGVAPNYSKQLVDVFETVPVGVAPPLPHRGNGVKVSPPGPPQGGE